MLGSWPPRGRSLSVDLHWIRPGSGQGNCFRLSSFVAGMHGGRHASPPSLPFFSLPVVALWACSASGAPAPFSAGRPGHCVLLQPAPIHAGFRAEADSARGELFLGLVFLWPSSLLRIPEQLILRRSSIRQTQTPRHFYASPPIHLCCHPPMIDFPMICAADSPPTLILKS